MKKFDCHMHYMSISVIDPGSERFKKRTTVRLTLNSDPLRANIFVMIPE